MESYIFAGREPTEALSPKCFPYQAYDSIRPKTLDPYGDCRYRGLNTCSIVDLLIKEPQGIILAVRQALEASVHPRSIPTPSRRDIAPSAHGYKTLLLSGASRRELLSL